MKATMGRQGSFKAWVKHVLRGDKKKSRALQFGCVKVEKDTAEILIDTLMVPLNNGLGRMLKGNIAFGVTPDGAIHIVSAHRGGRWSAILPK
jgi:hypothetical protein